MSEMDTEGNGVDKTQPSIQLEPTPSAYYRQVNSQRFTIELEFLSSLANPSYLVHLQSLGYFKSPSFIRYLACLHKTWSQPRYVQFLRYPNAILFCKTLAESQDFRDMIGRDGWEGEMTKQIVRQWANGQAGQGALNLKDEKIEESDVMKREG